MKPFLKIIGFALAVFSSQVFAGSANTSLTVSTNVSANCTITTTNVAFPEYNPIAPAPAGNLTGNGTVTITCTKGASPKIGIDTGSNSRKMKGTTAPNDLLAYELYWPTTPTTCPSFGTGTVWGNTGTALYDPGQAPSKAPRTYNICGQLAANQDVSTGDYSDTVKATVNF